MRTFLRCFACAILAIACSSTRTSAQTATNAGSFWQQPPLASGVLIRIAGRQYIVNAALYNGPIYWLAIPQNSTMTATASIHAADGGFLPTTVRATNITLLSLNRPVWRSPLTTSIFYLRPIWLPPAGWGEYQASGGPLLQPGTSLIARIEVRTGRSGILVDVPVVVPRLGPILADPSVP